MKPDITSWPFLKFCAAYFIVTYADYFNLLGYSTAGIGALGKWAFFAALIAAFGSNWLRSRTSALGLNAPTIFLLFTIVSTIPLVMQVAGEGDTNSYASAFIPSLIYATGLTFDREKYSGDYGHLVRRVEQVLLVLCLLYIGELVVRNFSGISYFLSIANQTNHVKSLVFVAALSLAYLTDRSASYMAMLIVLTGFSELLRPSSSLLLALAACAPVAICIRHGWLRAASASTFLILAIAAVVPFALYYSPEARDLVTSMEVTAKSDALGGASNTIVRLTIMDIAFQRIEASSWFYGELFSTGTAVQVSGLLPFWTENYASGLAQIHSDYVCVLLEGGLAGYAAFNFGLVMIVRTALGIDRRSSADSAPLRKSGAIFAVILAIYCSANPLLQGYQVAAVVWGLLVVAHIAREPARHSR